MARLLTSVRRRNVRVVRRHGIDLDAAADEGQSDPLALDAPVLAEIQGASVLGRVATGPRAGHWVIRLGGEASAPVVSTGGPRHANRQGFDLHANVAVRAGDRRRLEHLRRYVLRPPVAQYALTLMPEGRERAPRCPPPVIKRPTTAAAVAPRGGSAGAPADSPHWLRLATERPESDVGGRGPLARWAVRTSGTSQRA